MYIVKCVLCELTPVEADVARHGTLPGGAKEGGAGVRKRAEARGIGV